MWQCGAFESEARGPNLAARCSWKCQWLPRLVLHSSSFVQWRKQLLASTGRRLRGPLAAAFEDASQNSVRCFVIAAADAVTVTALAPTEAPALGAARDRQARTIPKTASFPIRGDPSCSDPRSCILDRATSPPEASYCSPSLCTPCESYPDIRRSTADPPPCRTPYIRRRCTCRRTRVGGAACRKRPGGSGWWRVAGRTRWIFRVPAGARPARIRAG
mmetsp:Transcript_15559/g.37318  ORF Transcript_15559/g.37318 Transcript_15559/m.37318 type:complete len:217 (+) Transcript_15559:2938-3588(+)